MSTDRVRFRLGLFMVAGIVLGVGGFLAVGASQLFRATIPVHFYFEDSVQGLIEGSDVTYRGVLVGRVSKIEMQETDENLQNSDPDAEKEPLVIHVEAEIYPDVFPRDPHSEIDMRSVEDWTSELRDAARRGLRSKLSFKGITGQMYLGLDVYSPKEYPEPPLSVRPQEPYIPLAKDPSLSDIQRNVGTTIDELSKIDWRGIATNLNKALVAITEQANGLDTKGLGQEAQATMRQVRETLAAPEVARSVARMDAISANLVEATASVKDLVGREDLGTAVDDLVATARELREMTAGLNERLPPAVDRFSDTLGSLETAVEGSKIPETMDTLRGAMTEVGHAARSVSSLRADLKRAVRDIADAAHFLARLARSLEENPSALMTGKRPPKEAE